MWKYASLLWAFTAYATAPQAILTDIEGTTTSISFVHDTLFPYAKEHVRDYLLEHHSEPAVALAIEEVIQTAAMPNADLEQVTEVLLEWMRQDKKIAPLKTLQGMMWKTGYEEGRFQGHVYEDAFVELSRWKSQGIDLYVYSSGSVPAQKLLFGYSTFGDMTPLFSDYFDTKIGGKKETSSYKKIAEQLSLAPDQILFLSDTVEELNAASEAGMQTLLITREETSAPAGCPHPSAISFVDIIR